MKKFVKIPEEELLALHKQSKEKDKYIKELEIALESVKRQLENAKATKSE